MMAAAFLFSACSTSDAFIARSFSGSVPLGAIMGFLVFGPMMDVKNILMLFAGFKKKVVLGLAALIFVLNFAVLYGLAFILL
ncbi:putative two-component membrane permease complex subunit SMU 747c [bioreactor metagenome]|uniref:Putative two-component membrane permease complex subunit SMU 747c n=1 Tax=bioreactor metagenome TaxID=1076179 RepID=A0A644WYQ0_9ZZZZ